MRGWRTWCGVAAVLGMLGACDVDATEGEGPTYAEPVEGEGRHTSRAASAASMEAPVDRSRVRGSEDLVERVPVTARPPRTSRLAYPFVAGFDGDAAREPWSLGGGWFLASDASRDGAGHLRLTAERASLVSSRPSDATMKRFVTLPEATPSQLSLWLRADAAAPARVVVEVHTPGAATWKELATLNGTLSGPAFTHLELPLDGFEGQAIRVRLRAASLGEAGGAVVFDVDDLRIGPLPEGDVAFPFSQGFASGAWETSGVWRVSSDDIGGGPTVDTNPGGVSQPALADGHTVTMRGFVRLPTGRPNTLGYRHHLELGDGDHLFVQVQTRDDARWQTIVAPTSAHARAAWSYAEHDLSAWEGEHVRVRFALRTAPDAERVRRVMLDGVRVGGLRGPLVAPPWQGDFSAAEGPEGWALGGVWDWVERAGGAVALSANPDGAEGGGLRHGHVAMARGFVSLQGATHPVLAYAFDGALVDPVDQVMVEVQRRGDGSWQTVDIIGAAAIRASGGWREVPLTHFVDDAVRVRFALAWGPLSGARSFEIAHVGVTDGPAAHAPFPYHEGFEDEGGPDGWLLDGAWAVTEADGAAPSHGGARFLDGNPGGDALGGVRAAHLASMYAYVPVPADAPSELRVAWRAEAWGEADRLFVEAQPLGGAWEMVAAIGGPGDDAGSSDAWRELRVGLDALGGRDVRFRLRLVTGAAEVARVVAVDDVAVVDAATP